MSSKKKNIYKENIFHFQCELQIELLYQLRGESLVPFLFKIDSQCHVFIQTIYMGSKILRLIFKV